MIKQHSDFAGDTNMPQAVRSVAGHFQVNRQIITYGFNAFQIETGHRKPVRQFIDGIRKRNVFGEPVLTDDHENHRLRDVSWYSGNIHTLFEQSPAVYRIVA